MCTHTHTHRLFFKTVLYSNNEEVLSQLVTVVMERAVLLYSIEFFQTEVRKVISDQLMEVFKLHSTFVVDFKQEILDFLGNLRSLKSAGEHFYMHLVSIIIMVEIMKCLLIPLQVWALGEYSHAGYDNRSTTTLLMQYFEVRIKIQRMYKRLCVYKLLARFPIIVYIVLVENFFVKLLLKTSLLTDTGVSGIGGYPQPSSE